MASTTSAIKTQKWLVQVTNKFKITQNLTQYKTFHMGKQFCMYTFMVIEISNRLFFS